ncbi:Uncharacterised protein [Citrobacter freundii]|nr:Uncharacterised protein [Citrobacter freundii]
MHSCVGLRCFAFDSSGVLTGGKLCCFCTQRVNNGTVIIERPLSKKATEKCPQVGQPRSVFFEVQN